MYYDRPHGGYDTPEEELSIEIKDIEVARKVGKFVVLKLSTGESFARRVKNIDEFIGTLTGNSSSISVVTY